MRLPGVPRSMNRCPSSSSGIESVYGGMASAVWGIGMSLAAAVMLQAQSRVEGPQGDGMVGSEDAMMGGVGG